ncbi:MAG: hypothetical protein CMK00_05510 [Planctomycetes bacterium]|nr:hypothetical protein [Planctomycetota bacterium]
MKHTNRNHSPLASAFLLALCACAASGTRSADSPASGATGYASPAPFPHVPIPVGSAAPATPLAEETPTPALPRTLGDHVRWALAHNPTLGGLSANLSALAEAPRQVGVLPDPKLSVTHYLEPVQTRVGPQRSAVGLTQALPWFGTLGLRAAAAEQQTAAAAEGLHGARLETARAVRRAWCELTYLGRVAAVLEENMALLQQSAQAVRARFTTGGASHGQLIRVDLERARLGDRLRAARGRRAPARARLARALGTPLPRPDDEPRDYGGLLEELDADGALPATAFPVHHPELRAARASIAGARARLSLAEKQRYPDLAFGLRWIETGDAAGMGGSDAGADPWLATVVLDLPLDRGRIAAGERAARARQRSAALALDRTRQSLEARLASARFDFEDAGRRMVLHEEALLPRASTVLHTTESAFRTGQATFNDLLDANRVLLDLALSLEGARRDRALARADLEALLARPLPQSDSISQHSSDKSAPAQQAR